MRLHRGGDRQANRALHMIIIGRIKHDQRTKDYIAKKLAQGHSKRDATRALNRYLCREGFTALKKPTSSSLDIHRTIRQKSGTDR
jgi:hypothetical protein